MTTAWRGSSEAGAFGDQSRIARANGSSGVMARTGRRNARSGAASPSSASAKPTIIATVLRRIPEFKLALKAILAACNDAGLDPRDIDGFASYSDERSEASRLAAALGTHRLRGATMQWGGGGGGCCAAVANAAASIVAGLADCVVVFRALAQGQYGRFGQTDGDRHHLGRKGVSDALWRARAAAALCHAGAPLHARARRAPGSVARRLRSRPIITRKPIRAPSCTASRSMPRNMMRRAGSPSPFISTIAAWKTTAPPRSCLCAEERARDFRHKPVYLLGAAVGSGYRTGAIPHNSPRYGSASFDTVAPDLYRMAGLGPSDVGVVQAYENFTGGVVMALAEHGFFKPEEANDFLTLENLIGAVRTAPAQHQRRQSCRMLHARFRAGARSRAPGPRQFDEPGRTQ